MFAKQAELVEAPCLLSDKGQEAEERGNDVCHWGWPDSCVSLSCHTSNTLSSPAQHVSHLRALTSPVRKNKARLQSPGGSRPGNRAISGWLAARPNSGTCFQGRTARLPTGTPDSQRARISTDLESESCFPNTRSN